MRPLRPHEPRPERGRGFFHRLWRHTHTSSMDFSGCVGTVTVCMRIIVRVLYGTRQTKVRSRVMSIFSDKPNVTYKSQIKSQIFKSITIALRWNEMQHLTPCFLSGNPVLVFSSGTRLEIQKKTFLRYKQPKQFLVYKYLIINATQLFGIFVVWSASSSRQQRTHRCDKMTDGDALRDRATSGGKMKTSSLSSSRSSVHHSSCSKLTITLAKRWADSPITDCDPRRSTAVWKRVYIAFHGNQSQGYGASPAMHMITQY